MPTIEVTSGFEAIGFAAEVPWAAISIADEEQWWPEIGEANLVGHLRLVFEDLEQGGGRGEQYFTEHHAQEVLEFVRSTWSEIEFLLITCEVGLSRGPAIAAALHRIHYGTDGEFFDPDRYQPNRLVYETMLEVAQRRGEYSPRG